MECLYLLTIFALFGVCSSDEGWFWHVTDFHWDFSYWTDQLSCNGMNISQPGTFGNQWCDSPWSLVEESIKGLGPVRSQVDFIIWTGKDLNYELVENITSLMQQEFPNTKVYATFGNHDHYPTNLFPPNNDDIYNATYLIWKAWINDDSQMDNFHKGGYYTVKLGNSLRLIALNSNMYYTKDTATAHLEDPADQFRWLEQTLNSSQAANEKVILIGHVPPGYTTPRAVRWMTKEFNQKFVDIVLRHSSTIAALHFGHEHHDSFRLFYKGENPVATLFIAPSVTPWRYQLSNGEIEPAHNPGARLVKFDRQTGKTLEILQYYADLDKVNANKQFVWTLGYNASSIYGIPDLGDDSMHEVVGKLTESSNSEFLNFVKWYNTNGKNPTETCSSKCHQAVICGLRHMTENAFQKCLDQSTSTQTMPIPNIFVTLVSLIFLAF
ncbi:ASM3B-like protein [Mya arenaria]|uniref:ASM3B-like protein n=1 Tax=Mya arenaria TaxID=6604 RepID=A0ABY7DM34_MYAAR|nr:ASM3B-like protein [Mya arenaria]